MAHFAKLNKDNVVIDINVVNNEDIQNLPFPESEPIGIAFLNTWQGFESNWKQTSYNGHFRFRYAAIGDTYNPQLDAFIPKKLYESWTLNQETCLWEPPVPYPTDGKLYNWNETTTNWVEVPINV